MAGSFEQARRGRHRTAHRLRTADSHAAGFDAIFACALLQHLPDPLPALREARRIARPGAVIGVADIDSSCYLISPADPRLTAAFDVNAKLRAGSPRTGRQLRGLLHVAGFRRCVARARAFHHGDPAETRALAEFNASWFTAPEVVEQAVTHGWATGEEMVAMSAAWLAWGRHPGAFVAGVWCEAVGWADPAP